MKIGIIGLGSWGCAIAYLCSKKGNNIIIWGRNQSIIEELNKDRTNKSYTGELIFPSNVQASSDVNDIRNSDLLYLALPIISVRDFLIQIKNIRCPIVICTKGIEKGTLSLPTQIIDEIIPDLKKAVLSGPNFALESTDFAASNISCVDDLLFNQIKDSIQSKCFVIERNKDITGTQVGGIFKNIIAIAIGISIALNLNNNFKAFLVFIGFSEMRKICKSMGGLSETLLDLSGVGDVFLTCGSQKSRNVLYGINLVKGRADYFPEGFFSCKSIPDLETRYSIKLPLFRFIYEVCHNEGDVKRIKDFYKKN